MCRPGRGGRAPACRRRAHRARCLPDTQRERAVRGPSLSFLPATPRGPWSRFRGCAPEGKSRILAAVPDRRRRLLHAVPAAALTVQVDGLTPPWEPLAGPGSRAPPAFLLPAALHAPTRGGCQGPPFPWRAGGLTPEAGLFKWGTRLSTQETSQTTGISPKKGSAAGSPGAAGPRQKTSKWGD